MLRPKTSFIPNVVSALFIKQDFVLPPLCVAAVRQEEMYPSLSGYDLDCAKSIFWPLLLFRNTHFVFVVLDGHWKGNLKV